MMTSCGSDKQGILVYSSNAVHGQESDSSEATDTDANKVSSASASVSSNEPTNLTDMILSRTASETYMSSLKLRSSIELHSNLYTMPWPLTSSDINIEEFVRSIPKEIISFVRALRVEDGQDISRENNVKLISICQDLMNFACRKLCTPKGFGLGLVLKHITGSKDVINLIHRLGHCASYDSVLAYETSLAQHALHHAEDLPDGFNTGPLLILVWDNIDFLEETKSGSGTTHHTNGMMMQLCKQSVSQQKLAMSQPRGKARAIKALPTIIVPLPQHSKTSSSQLKDVVVGEISQLETNVLEFSFHLARHQDYIKVTNWTGFNKFCKVHCSSPRSSLSYLPVIESPPTDIDTINQVMQDSIAIADRFDAPSVVVVVFDQAIYCKAKQLRFINPVLHQRLVPRMGEFHTVMTLLGVIGKRFTIVDLKIC